MCIRDRIWDTKEPWHDLADFMSQISERAYYAGWMRGLEYALWDAVQNGPRRYGEIEIDSETIRELRRLSTLCGGWVRYSEDPNIQEAFVPLAEWESLYSSSRRR